MKRLLPPTMVWLLLVSTVPFGLAVPGVGPLAWQWRVAGLFPMIGGLVLTKRANTLFMRMCTNVGTFDDPTRLVTSGLFAHTRNPMYLGFAVFLAGVAVVVGTITAWVAPVVFVVAADRWYIPFEERRLSATFRSEYDEYLDRVPRWFGPTGRAR